MELRPWDVLAREAVLDAPPWLAVARERVRLPDGREIGDFWTVDMPAYTLTVPLHVDGRVLAERSYKHGVRSVSWSLPAGYLEPGEDALAGARRELLEETGHAAARWSPLGSYFVDGNRGCGTAHIFLARELTRIAEPDSGDLEEIELAFIPFAELLTMLRQGRVNQLAMAAALGLAVIELGGRATLPLTAAPARLAPEREEA